MDINQGRSIEGYPHCGRTFICGDTIGVTDIRLSSDAYQFIVENGMPFVTASPMALNWGNKYSYGNQDGRMVNAPVVGCASHPLGIMGSNVDSPFYSSEAVGEIRPDFDGYAINLCFKFMTQAEYGNLGPVPVLGQGYRGQRLTIRMQNHAVAITNAVHTLVDIFVDYAWYNANVAAVAPVNVIDLAVNPRGFVLGEISNAYIVGQLPATMLRAACCQGSAFVRYEIPRAANGGLWGAGNSFQDAFGTRYANAKFDESTNPVTGFPLGGCGVLSIQLNTFWTGLGTIPTGVAGGTGGSRAITTYDSEAVTPLPAMGSLLDALTFTNLRERARSAIGASWTSTSIMSRTIGGVRKPIVGHSGVFTENQFGSPYDESATMLVQCPHGSNRVVFIALIRTVAGAGTHTVSATLANEAGTFTQSLMATTQAAGTGYRYIYFNASLNALMVPNSGLVERFTLRLRSQKSVPRSVQIVEPYQADGVLAAYLAFYQ